MIKKILIMILFSNLIYFSYLWFRPYHAVVGMMMYNHDVYENSDNLILRENLITDISFHFSRFKRFSGGVIFIVNDKEIEFPDALMQIYSDTSYITGIDILETKGRYTQDEAIDQWFDYVKLARSLPEWHEEGTILNGQIPFRPWSHDQAVNSGISADNTDRENAEAIMKYIGPDLPLGTRKIMLLSGRYKMVIKGKNFFIPFDLNMTYDQNRPKTPYRFAIHTSIYAGSTHCLGTDVSSFIERELNIGGPNKSFDPPTERIFPILEQAFEGWDRKDISTKTLRPYLDKYIFELCKSNPKSYDDFPDLTLQ